MKLSSSICVLLVSAGVFACSSSDKNGPTVNSASTQALIRALCAQNQKCDPLSFQANYGDLNTCISVETGGISTDLPGLDYTDAAINACASAVNSASCDTPFTDLAACRLKGTLANGAGCSDPTQCASTYCQVTDTNQPTNGAPCGTCAPVAADGAACTDDNGCNPGSQCDPTKHVCAPHPAKGAACDANGVACAGGSRCIKSVCADPVADGAACDNTEDDCGDASACVGGKCTPQSSLISIVQVGASCGADANNAKEDICQFSSCVGAQGIAKCVAFANAGEPCGTASQNGTQTAPDCQPNLDCDNGTCVKPTLTACP